jgi:hypothetical protein
MIGMINNDGKFEILYNNLKYNYSKKLNNIIINKSFIPLFKLEYDQTKCCICIEELLKNNMLTSLVVVLKCNHVFHITCLDRYIKMLVINQNYKESYIKCPLCNDCNINKLEFFYCYKKILEKFIILKKHKCENI